MPVVHRLGGEHLAPGGRAAHQRVSSSGTLLRQVTDERTYSVAVDERERVAGNSARRGYLSSVATDAAAPRGYGTGYQDLAELVIDRLAMCGLNRTARPAEYSNSGSLLSSATGYPEVRGAMRSMLWAMLVYDGNNMLFEFNSAGSYFRRLRYRRSVAAAHIPAQDSFRERRTIPCGGWAAMCGVR